MCVQNPITIYTAHTVSISAYLENGSEDRGFALEIEFRVDPKLDKENI